MIVVFAVNVVKLQLLDLFVPLFLRSVLAATSQRHVELPEVLGVNVPERIEDLLICWKRSRDFEALKVLFIVHICSQLLQAHLRLLQSLLNCLLN